jgi:hypothetical protein
VHPKSKIKATELEATEAAKAPRTTRSTAGPGYDFEDQVAGWILLRALLDQPVIEGFTSTRLLQAQTAALGWLVDDLLLTDDAGRHIAISCKDNLQVSSSGLPCSTRSSMRALSMSETFSDTTSEALSPAP